MRALHNVPATSQRSTDLVVQSKPVYWSDIGGLDAVKAKIQQVRESLCMEFLSHL